MGKFPQELDSLWRRRRAELGRELTSCEGEQLAGELFQQWVDAGRYDELIRRVHHEYDIGGGEQELILLGYALREQRDGARIDALFRGLIKRRVKAFHECWAAALEGSTDGMVAAAKRRAAALEAYREYHLSLHTLGRLEEAASLKEEMQALQGNAPARRATR